MIKPLFAPEAAPGLVGWVKEYCRSQGLVAPGDKVLAAVSGGPDSVALLHILHRLQGELALTLGVGHFEHGLRGRDSLQDAAFVVELARSLDLPCHLGSGDVRQEAQTQKISLQMAARRLRLAFLNEVRGSHGYDKIALGHTADDQVELFLVRLLRGTGPEGLKGMWPVDSRGLIRPLLAVGKEVLLAWLHHEGHSYREDASNLSRTYLRNRVRLDLLPQLMQQYNPRLPAAVWRLMHLAQEEERLLAADTAALFKKTTRSLTPDLVVLDLNKWHPLPPAMQRRLLRHALGLFRRDQEITAAQTQELEALAHSRRSGGDITFKDCRVARAARELHFFRPLPLPAPEPFFLPWPSLNQTLTVDGPHGWRWTLTLGRCLPQKPPLSPWQAQLDADRLHPPLTVRPLKPGDRFRPLGAPGPKKLQDYLVDRKVPRWLRPHLLLLTDATQILWLPGFHIADPVKITSSTRHILDIVLQPATPQAIRIFQLLKAVIS